MRKGELSEHIYPERRRGLGPHMAFTVLTFPLYWLRFAKYSSAARRHALEQYPILPCKPTPSEEGLNNAESSDLGWSRCIYYLKHKKSKEQKDSTTFQERAYYRDAQHRAHWVTPPPEGIQVPEAEAQP